MDRSSAVLAGLCVVFLGSLGILAQTPVPLTPKKPARITVVTFTRDVAPILYAHCTSCHRPGEIGPMSLVTYHDARAYAAHIRDAATNHIMPPWHAFIPNDLTSHARVDDQDVAVLRRWVELGAPQGDPKDLPPLPSYLRLPRPTH